MAGVTITFFGAHFRHYQGLILGFYYHLALAAEEYADPRPDWLQELAESWYQEALDYKGVGIIGDPPEEIYITNEERRHIAIQLADRAAEIIHSRGSISAQWLNQTGIGGVGRIPEAGKFAKDWTEESIERLLDVAEKYKQMLREGNIPPEKEV